MNSKAAFLSLCTVGLISCKSTNSGNSESIEKAARINHTWECFGSYQNVQGRNAKFNITIDQDTPRSKVQVTISGENVHHDFVTSNVSVPRGAYEGGARKDDTIRYVIKDISKDAAKVNLRSLSVAGVDLGDMQSLELVIETWRDQNDQDLNKTFGSTINITRNDGKARPPVKGVSCTNNNRYTPD